MAGFLKLVTGCVLMMVSWSVFSQETSMARVEGGSFLPLYGTSTEVTIESFMMDRYPVTNAQFAAFLEGSPQWKRSRVKRLFADSNYLRSWAGDLDPGPANDPDAPVTNVSWYAAKEFCECQGKRLPKVEEWEYAAMASEELPDARADKDFNSYILSWYETPTTYDNQVGKTFRNYWGIYDLHGLVWEWTLDYNSVLISGESRKDAVGDNSLFCGAAAVSATDLMNYAAFMRYAFRGSIKASYAIENLGCRCVGQIAEQKNML